MKNLYVRLSANVAEFRQQMHAAGASTRAFGNEVTTAAAASRQSFDRIGKAGMIAGGLIVAGLGAATVAAAKFEQGMRNANSIMGQTEAELKATSAAVLDMSRRVPQSAQTLAAGLYDVASSGFQGAAGLEVLEASAIAATAGMSDTATAARAITGVLNAYGMASSEAGRVSDVLFQTVNVGVVTFEELAQNVGDFVSTAAALGITVEETGAALATMTLAGINAAEASTALNRVMSSFIKPSDEMASAIRGLGYESGAAMIEALGLKGSVEAISGVADGSIGSLAAMYGEVRAIKGALALGAAEGRNYAKSTEAMTKASDGAGAATEAYNEQSKAFLVQLQQAKNSVGAFAIQIGTTFLPVMTNGAKIIGSVADAFAQLPGPLRTAAVIFTGLAAAVALFGGAALVAAPKVAALKLAMLDLATSPAVGPRTTKAITGMAGALGMLGKASLVAGVLLTLKASVDSLRESLADDTEGATPLARDLELLAKSGKANGALVREFGEDLDGLVTAMDRASKLDAPRGSWDTAFDMLTGREGDLQTGKQQLEDLNAAFKELFASDPAAATKAWGELVAQWEAAGHDVGDLIVALPEVTAGLDANADAGELAKAEMAALTEEAKALGINLDSTSDLLTMTAEEMDELRAATDPVIFSMLEAGRVTKEQAESMQEDLESFVQSVQQSFADATSPITIYGDTLERVNDDAKKAWDKAGKEAEDFTERATLSLDEFVSAMGGSVMETQAFANGITEAIRMGYDPTLIAQLLQAGPEAAGPLLETLLSDHSGRMVGMVNDSVAALRDLNDQAVQMARLTHLATTAETDAMAADLGTAMAIAQQKAALGADATGQAIAIALDLRLAEVQRIAREYGIALASAGAEPVFSQRNPDGVVVRKRANGGVDAPHTAQIAPGGAWRLWAEPETGGEAYIPLAPSKRKDSLRIWQETGRHLGVLGFASGGLTDVQRQAKEARDVQRTITDNAYELGAMTYQDYVAELDRRMAAEQRFTTEWKQQYDRRAAVAREFADGLTAVYDQQQAQLDNQFSEERLATTEYLKILRDRHARAVDLTGYWGNEATAIRQQIRDEEERAWNEAVEANTEAMERQATAESIMYAEGALNADDYIAALKKRHEAIAAQYGYWSDEAHAIRDEIRGVQDDMARDAEEAADKQAEIAEVAARRLEQVQTQLANIYERAADRFRAQQAEYDRMVEQARSQTVGELTSVYQAAQRRFSEQADALEKALADRNARMTERVQELRDSVAAPLRETGDLLATFGRSGQAVSGDEIVAMLNHRIEAAQRWDTALRDLQAGGLNSDLVTRLAQAGPGALGLAEALQSLDPAVVNDAMAQLAAMGDSLADVFVTQEQAAIAAEVAAEVPLPAMQSFNDLLTEETALWQQANADRATAQAWAEGMATTYMPAVNYEWRTFDDLLAEEIANANEAEQHRQEAEDWAERMASKTRGLNSELRELIENLRDSAREANPDPDDDRPNTRPIVGPKNPPPVSTKPKPRPGQSIESAQRERDLIKSAQGKVPMFSFDQGGYLPVGLSLAYNGTGRPEPVGHGLGAITVMPGAIVQTIEAAPGTDTAAVREAAHDGAADGLREVLAGLDRRVRS